MNSTQDNAPPPTPSSEQETVRKVYARDLRDKDRVHTVFRVAKKSRQVSRAGKVFLALTLADRTGEVDARIFERAEALEGAFAPEDYVLVQGEVITFHGRPQVVIAALDRLDPEPIDPKEFAFKEEGSRAVEQIRELVERVQDPHVRALLLSFLDDPEVAALLPNAPAAKGIHHAYKGGLADHLLSVMKLAHRVADHYPMADRDLLVAGALLHDIGKVKEITTQSGNFQYTDEGRLVGHLVMTAQQIHAKASRIDGFPPLLEHHLTHLVLAHHGQLEHGSPKLPVTLEALIVHAIDALDSRIASWLELMAADSNETWTDHSKLYERHLWKGPAPTARGRSPVAGRKPKGPKAPRREGKKGGAPEPKPQARPEAHRPPEAPAMSFKPLEDLTRSLTEQTPKPQG